LRRPDSQRWRMRATQSRARHGEVGDAHQECAYVQSDAKSSGASPVVKPRFRRHWPSWVDRVDRAIHPVAQERMHSTYPCAASRGSVRRRAHCVRGLVQRVSTASVARLPHAKRSMHRREAGAGRSEMRTRRTQVCCQAARRPTRAEIAARCQHFEHRCHLPLIKLEPAP
jgi:hypothetical protein